MEQFENREEMSPEADPVLSGGTGEHGPPPEAVPAEPGAAELPLDEAERPRRRAPTLEEEQRIYASLSWEEQMAYLNMKKLRGYWKRMLFDVHPMSRQRAIELGLFHDSDEPMIEI